MSDYIRREDAVNTAIPAMVDGADAEIVEGLIYMIEPADVVPVVHGKWIDEDPAFAEYFANCSVCGYEIDVHNERGYFNFCPNCGAKMDGGK